MFASAINFSFKFGHPKTNAVLEAVQTQTNAVVETAQQITQNTSMLESILGFFAFGALGFWLLIIALSIIYTISVEVDKHGFAIFATILAILLGWTNVTWLFHNWQLLLIGIAAYGIAGGAWSVFRWFRYCRKFIETHPVSAVDSARWASVGSNREYVKMTPEEHLEALKKHYTNELKPSYHKSRLIGWIVYWPWSLVWNFAGDFFTGIYDALANIYNRVSASVINKALKP